MDRYNINCLNFVFQKCGRLLYCGQDDWVHVNCALWSAEVFQQQDGSLRNVYPAIARGKLMVC